VTPVFVYTSGDEAELFLNGKSLGRKAKEAFAYRIRWNEVVYEPGELKVVAYKNGKKWAEDSRKTAGRPAKLAIQSDRTVVSDDGRDLAYVTVSVCDKEGIVVPDADNLIHFGVSGPAVVASTDNGDATDFESFQSSDRKAFHGLGLAVVRTRAGETGPITIVAEADGLEPAKFMVMSDAAE
jgi:beta-galactosidase